MRQLNKSLGPKGTLQRVYAKENSCPFVYLRGLEEQRILIALNPSSEVFEIDLEKESFGFKSSIETLVDCGVEFNRGLLRMNKLSYGVYKV